MESKKRWNGTVWNGFLFLLQQFETILLFDGTVLLFNKTIFQRFLKFVDKIETVINEFSTLLILKGNAFRETKLNDSFETIPYLYYTILFLL